MSCAHSLTAIVPASAHDCASPPFQPPPPPPFQKFRVLDKLVRKAFHVSKRHERTPLHRIPMSVPLEDRLRMVAAEAYVRLVIETFVRGRWAGDHCLAVTRLLPFLIGLERACLSPQSALTMILLTASYSVSQSVGRSVGQDGLENLSPMLLTD